MEGGRRRRQRRPCRPCGCRRCLRLRLCIRLPPAGCLHAHRVHLAGAAALAKALARRTTGFCAPLEPPSSGKGGRAGEGRMTTSRRRQRRRFGRRPPRQPSSSAATIVTLVTPLSSSVIAVTTFLSLGCDATMRSSAGEEGGAPASAPMSPVERTSLPLPQRSWRRHQVIVRVVRGGAEDLPSSSCRQPKDPTAVTAVVAVPAWWGGRRAPKLWVDKN